jgi:hypothetical protein
MKNSSGGPLVRPRQFSSRPRAALIWTGFLRDSCSSSLNLERLARVADSCRSAFSGSCDVFIHTWSRLDKAGEYGERLKFGRCMSECVRKRARANESSLPCVSALVERVQPSAVAIEQQELANSSSEPGEPLAWSQYLAGLPGEASRVNVRNFAMNAASMAGGVRLMLDHAAAMRLGDYAAAIRMRADYGGLTDSQFLDQFLVSPAQWKSVRKRAEWNHQQELYMCDHPRLKRIDVCFWSAPAAPLAQAVIATKEELHGDRLLACRDYLNRSLRVPVFTESILMCGMRAAHVGPATTAARPALQPAVALAAR